MNLLSCHVFPRWMMLPRESSDIQTIASNRITGCGAPLPKRIGFAFYVNSWMSSDLKLKVCSTATYRVLRPSRSTHKTTLWNSFVNLLLIRTTYSVQSRVPARTM
jgi:hypothetical protein